MKISLKTGLLVCLLLLAIPPLKAQTDTLKPTRAMNVLHGDLGILGFSVSYERTIYQWQKSHLNLRTGVGYVITFEQDDGINIFPSLQLITGDNWFHFEFGLGINLVYDDFYPMIIPLPLVMVGIRIEPPVAGPVFRLGIGTENSIISAGMGWTF